MRYPTPSLEPEVAAPPVRAHAAPLHTPPLFMAALDLPARALAAATALSDLLAWAEGSGPWALRSARAGARAASGQTPVEAGGAEEERAAVADALAALEAEVVDLCVQVQLAEVEQLVDVSGGGEEGGMEALDVCAAHVADVASRLPAALAAVRRRLARDVEAPRASAARPASAGAGSSSGSAGEGGQGAPAGLPRRSPGAEREALFAGGGAPASASAPASGAGARASSLELVSAVQATSAMRATNEQLRREVERMAAVRALLARDGESLARTRAAHAEYGGDVVESAARVRMYKRKEERDRLYVRAAFAAFALAAVYISVRRLAWFILGLRLPGL